MNSDTEPDISDSEESEILVCNENRLAEPERVVPTYTFYHDVNTGFYRVIDAPVTFTTFQNDANTGFQIAGPSVPTYTFYHDVSTGFYRTAGSILNT